MHLALAALLAVGPCDEPEARAFDFWVGEWNVNNRYRTARGWVDAGTATNEVFHVLDGCAVVELWDGHLGQNQIRGFSVRAWSPSERQWVLVLNWPQPDRAPFGTLRGEFRHGRGDFVVENADADGDTVLTRYTFSDITERSLRWNDGTSTDGGATWRTSWIMEFTRRDPLTDPPLRNVPLADPGRIRLCAGDGFRGFDDMLGRWTGADPAGTVRSARLESIAIVGECAILDQLSWEDADGAHEALLVRAWSPDSGQWEQRLLDTDRREFVTMHGPAGSLATEDRSERMQWTAEDTGMVLTWTLGETVRRFTLTRRR